jgi:hypothetical protein
MYVQYVFYQTGVCSWRVKRLYLRDILWCITYHTFMRTIQCLDVWLWCRINSQKSYVHLRYENIIWFSHDNRPQMPAIQHVPELLYDNVSTTLIKSQIRGWLRTTEWKNWSVVNCDLLSHHSAIPVAARSKGWVYSCSLAGNGVTNPAEEMDVCLLWMLRVFR